MIKVVQNKGFTLGLEKSKANKYSDWLKKWYI